MTDDGYPLCVVWLDPGGTTGIATLLHSPQGYAFAAHQETGTEEAAECVAELIEWDAVEGRFRTPTERTRVWVGWEDYLVTDGGGRAGDPVPSLEVIGAVKYLCHANGARVLPAVPGSHRTVAAPELLRRLGWWTRGQPHAQDASRHLVAWLMREKQARRLAH